MGKERKREAVKGTANAMAQEIINYNKSLHSSHVQHQKGLLHPSYRADGKPMIQKQERPSNNVQSSPKIGDSQHSYTSQNAHLPHLPVLQQSGIWSQLLYVPGLGDSYVVSPFSAYILPGPVWWIYGKVVVLDQMCSVYSSEDNLKADLIYFSKSLVGFQLGEYNPDVSLSYIWGNKSYWLKRLGSLPDSYVPIPVEYEQGEQDNDTIILELSQDLAEMLEEAKNQ